MSSYWLLFPNCEIVLCSSTVGMTYAVVWMSDAELGKQMLIYGQRSFSLYSSWVRVEQCSMQVLSDQDRRRLKWRSMARRFNLRLCWELLKSICWHSIRLKFDLDWHNRWNYLLCLLHLFICLDFELWGLMNSECEFLIIGWDDDLEPLAFKLHLVLQRSFEHLSWLLRENLWFLG